MKTTAQAPANIALIKYWGKANKELRLPLNSSISVNLSRLSTITTVEFLSRYEDDEISIENLNNTKNIARVIKHLDRIRKLAGKRLKARVVSKNNFPGAAGLASSASGFAALTLAATKAIGLRQSKKELSILARQGSGSACRSVPDGWVKWEKGTDDKTSYSFSLHSKDFWPEIRILSVIVNQTAKKIATTKGMANAHTSPFLKTRLLKINQKIIALEKAIQKKDFTALGEIIESEALELHTITFTQKPAIIYWLPITLTLIKEVWRLREAGLAGYFTIDAGPHLKVFCLKSNCQEISKQLKKISGVKKIIINKVGNGARLVGKHLF